MSDLNIEVSIVTVGMNHRPYMQAFLRSLYHDHTPGISFEMIYVDNCSQDGSVDFINKEYPQVKIIRNNRPLGFAENNNLGARQATGRYIAILNPDIVLKNSSVDALYAYAEKLDYDAVLAPKLLNPDGSLQFSARGFITPRVLGYRLLTRGDDATPNKAVRDYLFTEISGDEAQFIDWAVGAALFMKNSLYKDLGGFDTGYFLYLEDTDLCLRAWRKGYPVIYVPASEMIHDHLRGSRKLGKKMYLHLKSYIRYFTKFGINVRSQKGAHSFRLPG